MLWAPLALVLVQETREERVLELVRAFELRQPEVFWYGSAHFEHAEPAAGEGPRLVARTNALCGNRLCTPEPEEMRALARELFTVFGLDASGRAAVPALDGFDRAHGVGFVVRLGSIRSADEKRDEPSLDELAALRRGGLRVHVGSLDEYVSTEDDRFTPTLAYLGGLVGFLNEVTEGEDVELGGLLFEREATLAWPEPGRFELGPGVHWTPEGPPAPLPDARLLTFERTSVVRVPFEGAAALQSTLGAPSVLALSAVKAPDGVREERLFPAPAEHARVIQTRPDGTRLVHEARSLDVFLPDTFDLARPFVLELELGPGHYRLNAELRLGAAVRD